MKSAPELNPTTAVFCPRPDCPKCKGSGVVPLIDSRSTLIGALACDCPFPRDSDGKPQ